MKNFTQAEEKKLNALKIKMCVLSQQVEALAEKLEDTLSCIESAEIPMDLRGLYSEDVLNAPYIEESISTHEWMLSNYTMIKAAIDMLNINLAEASDELDALSK